MNYKFLSLVLLILTLSCLQMQAKNKKQTSTAAQDFYEFVEELSANEIDEDLVKTEFAKLSKRDQAKVFKIAIKDIKECQATGGDVSASVGMIIVAILLPPLAVGLSRGVCSTFWINLLLTILGYLPGIIHAIIVI